MYRIIDGRGTGKTSRLLLLAKENNGIVVCKNPEVMREKAYRYGITGIDFISYQEYINCVYGIGKNPIKQPVFIDEIEMYLRHYDDNLKGYTISNED